MPNKFPILGDCYVTQVYGLTDFARSEAGKKAYKSFPNGIHPGYDFGTHGVNLPVVALVAGTIVRAGWDGGWGYHIELEAQDGFRRQYAHLSAILVKVGDTVEPGAVLGRVGSTGNSTGTHLHYGLRRRKGWSWEYRDPIIDFEEKPPAAKMPTKKLIKADDPLQRAVYVFNGSRRFPIPDWDTKIVLFGEGSNDIELVSSDILSKIPMGETLISLK